MVVVVVVAEAAVVMVDAAAAPCLFLHVEDSVLHLHAESLLLSLEVVDKFT